MSVRLDVVVPGGFGGGWEARSGEFVTIVDLEGGQVGDFVALAARDPAEWLSPSHCRENSLSIFVRQNQVLVSNRRRPILEIVRDDVGVHDGTIPACDPYRYSVDFGVPGHRNCLENLSAVLRSRGVTTDAMPEALNLFQNTPLIGDATMGLADPVSQQGDRIVFRAMMDTFGALSACPQDIIPGNSLRPTPLRLVVANGPFSG